MNGTVAERLHARDNTHTTSDRQPRRVVELTGFGVLHDGTTFGVTVLDLSYDGCKVQSQLALMPGLRLKFSIVSLGRAIDAVVRWYKDGQAGLRFNPDEEAQPEQRPRRHRRIEVRAQISLRRQGRHHYFAQLFDLAPTGCKVEFVERPRPGEMLWAKFEGLEALEARVCWVNGFFGGIEFVRPIYPAVFDLLLTKLTA